MTAADLLVLAPWLIFGAALAAICYRLPDSGTFVAGLNPPDR